MGDGEDFSTFIARIVASRANERAVAYLVEQLRALPCRGLADKLDEYKGRGCSAPDLIAELRMAIALLSATGARLDFQSGAAADLRLDGDGVNWTVEVEHKSAVSPFAAIFYPGPDDLAVYARSGVRWQSASARLHEIIRSLPIEIQPWIGGKLDEPCWGGSERAKQEETCGAIAEWLADELTRIEPGNPTQLTHELARFDVSPVEGRLGRIAGAGPLDTFWLREYPSDEDPRVSLSSWLRDAIVRKSKKDPVRHGSVHFVGLVVDEAFACHGHVLTNTFLGGLVASGGGLTPMRHFRPVPKHGVGMIEDARNRGRGELLDLMYFDSQEPSSAQDGLVFDAEVQANVDGVFALYYTNLLQFIPNPFSRRNVDVIRTLLPKTLLPFDPATSSTTLSKEE